MSLCPSCSRAPCARHTHPTQPGYVHHASGCPQGVRVIPRRRAAPHAQREAPRATFSDFPPPTRTPSASQAVLSSFYPRTRADHAKARRVIEAHGLAWALGGKRLDPHTFNLRYFPFLGTYQCRSLYSATRAAVGVRWPG